MDWPRTSVWRDRPARPTRRWVSHAAHDAIASPHRPIVGGAVTGERDLVSSSTRLVTLDGSSGEGGGQILRTAIALSLLSGRPFRIVKIRANRDKPGLRPQHLKAVEAAAALSGAEVTGARVGSRELTFRPASYTPGDLHVEIGTAGSTALVLHTLHLPIALRAEQPVRLVLTGGTFNTRAPSYPFLEIAWRAYMSLLGMPLALTMPAAGFFPLGGGRLEAWIEPATPQPLVLVERPALTQIRGIAGVGQLNRGIAERMRSRAVARLSERGLEADIQLGDWPSASPGAAIALSAVHGAVPTTFVGLGKRGKPAEVVADEAVDELLAFEDATGAVDPHSADQLLLPLALAAGRSIYTVTTVTDHLRTNAQTIQSFLDCSIRIEEPEQGPARVIVQ
jgi:RNA 3'-terminal phosphate cyclase (ATP)